MNTELSENNSDRNIRALVAICVLVYIAAYVGRLSYTSSMVGIMEATGTTKDIAGLVSTFFYLSYGTGQLVNAFFCRRYNPRPVIAGIMLVSGASNLLAFIVRSVPVIRFIWFVNGAAQSALWCTVIELLSHRIPPERKRGAILAMSSTSTIGTALIYSLSAFCIGVGHVFWIFAIAAILLGGTAAAWLLVTRRLREMPDYAASAQAVSGDASDKPAARPHSQWSILAAAWVMVLTMGMMAIGNGFIRDTMVTWIPSLLYDRFGMPSSASVVITLVLPLFSLAGAFLGVTLHKKIRGTAIPLSILFTMSAAALGGVYLSYRLHSMIPVILFSGLNGCIMASVNNFITSIIPLEQGEGAGLFAGVMDAFCYVGSTVSGFLPGLILERYAPRGFDILLPALPVLALLLVGFSIAAAFGERRRKQR